MGVPIDPNDHPMQFAPRLYSLVACLALLAGCVSTPPAASPDAAQRLHALFGRHWEESLRSDPERATFLGDPRYADRLTDNSPAGRSARAALLQRTLDEAQAIP